VVTHLDVPPSRIRVIPHGVHPPDQILAQNQRDQIILCVGALQIRKNVIRLVEAFERLPLATARNWKLVLAGSTAGFGAAEIVRRIENSPRVMQIQLRGYVTAAELRDLYRRAAIFAFPSLDEGFGIPVLEAMAHGTPVLTSNRSALPEVASGAGLLVDPYESDEIYAALGRLIEDTSLRTTLANAGIKRAKLFPWKRAVQETWEAYAAAGVEQTTTASLPQSKSSAPAETSDPAK
jgi:glycosyltransferase involved in cell wall biosynthesis